VYGIAAPVLTENQQVPLPTQRFDARRDFDRNDHVLEDAEPEVVILDRARHEFAERLTPAIPRLGDHRSRLTEHVDMHDSIFFVRLRNAGEAEADVEIL